VPLYYISRVYSDFKLVHVAMSTLTLEEHYKFGMCIGEAVRNSDEDVVFVASGDLAHRLTSDGPYGYNKHAPEFDELLVKSIEKDDIDRILDIDDKLRDEAAECGLRSYTVWFLKFTLMKVLLEWDIWWQESESELWILKKKEYRSVCFSCQKSPGGLCNGRQGFG